LTAAVIPLRALFLTGIKRKV